MGLAYKCDICGGLYENKSTHDSGNIFLSTYRRGVLKACDVCQDCWDAIEAEIAELREAKQELVTPLTQEDKPAKFNIKPNGEVILEEYDEEDTADE
jgi:hypothetical protein